MFELLLQGDRPQKAYDLIAAFKLGGVTAPPTVYRALDALMAAGLVHRIASLNAYVAPGRSDQSGVASYLICDICGEVEELPAPNVPALAQLRREGGFETRSMTIEARGRCGRCREAEPAAPAASPPRFT